MKSPDQDDAKLAAKIGDAVKAYDAADATRREKAVILGRLLIEARKRHPSTKAFENFLEMAGGIRIRRAEELISFALSRKDFEQHRIENAAAQQPHRDKIKAGKIEREKAKAALPSPEAKGPRVQNQDRNRNQCPNPRAEAPGSLAHYVMRKSQPRASASLRPPADPISRSSTMSTTRTHIVASVRGSLPCMQKNFAQSRQALLHFFGGRSSNA